MQDKIQLL